MVKQSKEQQFKKKGRPHCRRIQLTTALNTLIKQRYKSKTKKSPKHYSAPCKWWDGIVNQCVAEFEYKFQHPQPQTFMKHTSQIDLLYFLKQLQQLHVLQLSWDSAKYLLFKFLQIEHRFHPQFQQLIDDCTQQHLHYLRILHRNEGRVRELQFELDIEKEGYGDQQLDRQLKKVAFHLINQTMSHTKIKITR